MSPAICCSSEMMSADARSYWAPQISVLSRTLVSSALIWILPPRCTIRPVSNDSTNQLFPGFWDVHLFAPIAEDGAARLHLRLRQMGQAGHQRFRQSVAEHPTRDNDGPPRIKVRPFSKRAIPKESASPCKGLNRRSGPCRALAIAVVKWTRRMGGRWLTSRSTFREDGFRPDLADTLPALHPWGYAACARPC
jgi:hypothetical protein